MLPQIIISCCNYAFFHGCFTWNHNKVLLVVIKATRTACSVANIREMVQQRGIYVLQGKEQLKQSHQEHWEVVADIEAKRLSPGACRKCHGTRCHAVLHCSRTIHPGRADVALAVQNGATSPKEDKYFVLTLDLQQKGHKA